MSRVLVIDNFDSFTNNIVQYLHEITGERPIVVDNRTRYEDLPLGEVDSVVISPGPGHPSVPEDFGVCREVIERHPLPILGVCLGHQGIAVAFGGSVVHAPEPVHGMIEEISHNGTGLFTGLPAPLRVVRYHSLVATDLPPEIEVTARSADGLVMALRHRTLPIWGVQFHPESIDTDGGRALLSNFLDLAGGRAGADSVTAAFERVGGVLRGVVHVTEVDWPRDLSAHFRQARAAGARFWLDAENSEHPDAGYSLMGIGGRDVTLAYEVSTRRLSLHGPLGSDSVTGDLFLLLDQLLAASAVREADGPTPFTSGFVGYLGYELKELVGAGPSRRSEVPDAGFAWAPSFLVFDHRSRRAWRHDVATGGAVPHPPAPIAAVEEPDAQYTPGPVPEAAVNLRDGHRAYVSKIEEAKRLIRDGESYEVCLTNSATAPAPADPLEAYERMRSVSPVPYGAFLELPGLAILSSSPETFLRIGADATVVTRPIKGTRPRGPDPVADQRLREELASSRKDRAENLMIVDLVRHDLNAVCEPGSVTVPSPFEIQSFPSVHQLVSTVVGVRAEGVSSVDVVRSCFPPGSMTGAPKRRTMEIIDRLEGAARGPYSGALGWFDHSGAITLSVVIRTVVVTGDRATFGVGGAITALSDPEDEFEETLVKASVPAHGVCRSPVLQRQPASVGVGE
ncbi:aminodeoxychorismate synthase component I [Rathayibacter tanaceti]|uniref:aminodeoxychorismate synthase n=2 Tax=Rathayibacter tanaceti TaxID=1671680 RepID=A0A162G1F4_9MICO|nr:aminodeoxychorismate synthase component I [Rathayibacter tanaceti]KZX22720.1 Aminodeoxychorismate synthase component 1 [Rathayibacter tanaceti]QHC55908.1 aminodeoxychorismate synthase component I [Rathayibacter tanaceti]TCO39259.1 para-aminobenzoate synthetase [Rathayibacter tanaceti]